METALVILLDDLRRDWDMGNAHKDNRTSRSAREESRISDWVLAMFWKVSGLLLLLAASSMGEQYELDWIFLICGQLGLH